jgi:prepilin-type processing-associated H-X9-DG protein
VDISFTCPHCGEVTLVGEEFVGQSGECRGCGQVVTVPPVSISSADSSGQASKPSSVGTYVAYAILAVIVLAICGIYLLPEFDQARVASRRMQSGNHLKMIALAMQNYHSTYKQLPRAYWLTPQGERTLSWRVAISDYLSEMMILKEYKSSEPWDSAANREIAKRTRSVFAQPGSGKRSANETGYMVITGPGTLFEEGKDISFADCSDGLETTILAVEVKDSGVNWLQPIDLDIRNMNFKINSGGMGIGSPWKGGAQVVFADGSVRFLSNDTLEATQKAMLTRAGGETIPAD